MLQNLLLKPSSLVIIQNYQLMIGNYMKFPVNMLKISLLIKFTKETCLFAKLPVIMHNYQFRAFTPTYIYAIHNTVKKIR